VSDHEQVTKLNRIAALHRAASTAYTAMLDFESAAARAGLRGLSGRLDSLNDQLSDVFVDIAGLHRALQAAAVQTDDRCVHGEDPDGDVECGNCWPDGRPEGAPMSRVPHDPRTSQLLEES
jgi:hypothetical protein